MPNVAEPAPAEPAERASPDEPAAPASAHGRVGRDPIRHLRWLVPLGLALIAFVVVSLVEAIHNSHQLSATTAIQSAGFSAPTTSVPASFSLPVLQPAAVGGSAAGKTVTMSSLIGKPVVLNMWSSTCVVCKTETPDVESVARKAGKSVEFVGVDTLDERSAALDFLQRYHVSYLQLFDPTEHVGTRYGIPGLPVTVFVSARGTVVGEYLGALNTKTLSHYLTTLFGVRVTPSER